LRSDRSVSSNHFSFVQKWFFAAYGFSALVFLAFIGSESNPRLFAPFYVLFFAFAMRFFRTKNLRTRAVSFVACLSAASVVPLLILSPARPLFPAVRITQSLQKQHPESKSLKRASDVYQTYAERARTADPLLPFLQTDRIGWMNPGDVPEAPLWLPYGSRKVIEVFPQEKPCDRNLSTIVIPETALRSNIQYWLKQNHGETVAIKTLVSKISRGPENWYVVKIQCFSESKE
jgi:hypothetical protein